MGQEEEKEEEEDEGETANKTGVEESKKSRRRTRRRVAGVKLPIHVSESLNPHLYRFIEDDSSKPPNPITTIISLKAVESDNENGKLTYQPCS